MKMIRYVKEMVVSFPNQSEVQKEVVFPVSDSLFCIYNSPKLLKTRLEVFHNIIAKGLFVVKCAHPDIMVTIAFLCA